MINKSGLDRVIALLETDLTHIALGNGAAPTYTSTTLTNETIRAAVSEDLIDGTILVKELFLDESTGNGSYTEIGIFGDGATNTANSGKLFSSFGAAITKTNAQSLTISFEIEVLEVLQ